MMAVCFSLPEQWEWLIREIKQHSSDHKVERATSDFWRPLWTNRNDHTTSNWACMDPESVVVVVVAVCLYMFLSINFECTIFRYLGYFSPTHVFS